MTASPPQPDGQRAQTVHRLADDLGFALVGIAPASPSDYEAFFRQWLGEGRHGQMHYMAEHVEARLDPAKLLPGAKSIICVADQYLERGSQPPSDPHPPAGRIARYAWGDDYHRVMKKRLHDLADALRGIWPEHQFRTTVDTAPVLERELARRAGLGWIAKNTMLIHPQRGSWLLLGEILTTLPIQTAAEAGATGNVVADHCGSCTRCLDACPTQCLQPYQIEANRCISYLTLEHRDLINPALQTKMGDWIAGCDVCQEVCPFNAADKRTSAAPPADAAIRAEYQVRPPAPALSLLELLGWDAWARQSAFTRSALKRIKLEMLQRNALIAAGNYLAANPHDTALRRRIEELAHAAQEPELVRITARQVLKRLPLHPGRQPKRDEDRSPGS